MHIERRKLRIDEHSTSNTIVNPLYSFKSINICLYYTCVKTATLELILILRNDRNSIVDFGKLSRRFLSFIILYSQPWTKVGSSWSLETVCVVSWAHVYTPVDGDKVFITTLTSSSISMRHRARYTSSCLVSYGQTSSIPWEFETRPHLYRKSALYQHCAWQKSAEILMFQWSSRWYFYSSYGKLIKRLRW